VAEFAIKYCISGSVDVKVGLDKITENRKYMISFCFLIERNTNMEETEFKKLYMRSDAYKSKEKETAETNSSKSARQRKQNKFGVNFIDSIDLSKA